MIKDFPGEQWKPVQFNYDFPIDCRLEVSNFGRLRTFNKVSDGNLIKGSLVNGYPIVHLKFYAPRDEKTQAHLNNLQQQVFNLARDLKAKISNNQSEQVIKDTTELLTTFKKNVSKKFQDDLKQRAVNYQMLIHRLVADCFLPPPTPEQVVVAHLDHNKLNNRVSNLKWMTREENYEHQKKSPLVIEESQKRQQRQQSNPKRAKLTVTRVMLLKKLLNEGKPLKQLVKLFKVTGTQIIRIKRGENWANVPPLN